MYVPPIVATKIEQQNIVAGERFELCKTRIASGRQHSIEWHVRRKDPSPEIDLPESQLESDLRESIEATFAQKSQTPLLGVNGAETAAAPEVNGNGKPSAPAPTLSRGPARPTKLEHALKTAITAACSADKYGAALGYVVRFDSDAIKSMAITVLINMSEGGRR
jgi:hypothetical protein